MFYLPLHAMRERYTYNDVHFNQPKRHRAVPLFFIEKWCDGDATYAKTYAHTQRPAQTNIIEVDRCAIAHANKGTN